MSIKSQKEIASRILKCGISRIWIDPARGSDVSGAITANDVRRLIKDDVIKKIRKKGTSNFRLTKRMEQKKKGRRKGKGSRKGKIGTRLNKKKEWIKRIRSLRTELKGLRDGGQITKPVFRELYLKAKSGMFRSKAHLAIYMVRNNMVVKKTKEK